MIDLDEISIWGNLSSPYGNSEDIPLLLVELSDSYDKALADEIIWEYIYHQGSVYENTLATIPHLIQIIEESKSNAFNIDILASLGVVLIDLGELNEIENVFCDNLNAADKIIIQSSFLDSLEKFKALINKHSSDIVSADEVTKRYFLISYLVSEKKHHEAKIFKEFSENDEYMFVCPHCEEETFLWNEENILNGYSKDPIFNKDHKQILIELSDMSMDLEWLAHPIDKLNINSLQPLIKYFEGKLSCHSCFKKSNVFDGIMNSI